MDFSRGGTWLVLQVCRINRAHPQCCDLWNETLLNPITAETIAMPETINYKEVFAFISAQNLLHFFASPRGGWLAIQPPPLNSPLMILH